MRKVVYYLEEDDHITRDALALLSHFGFYAAPVRDAEGHIIGMFDLSDVNRVVIDFMARGIVSSLKVGDYVREKGERFMVISETATFRSVLKLMIEDDLHRLCVMGKGDRLSIISQIDVIDVFVDNFSSFKRLDTKILRLGKRRFLGFEAHALVTAREGANVFSALELMQENNISAVPIVLENKKIIGTISLKDVPKLMDHLFEPCGNFTRGTAIDGGCIGLHATLADIIKGFHITRFHRFWITRNEVVVSCISLTDVIRCVFNLQKKKRKKEKKWLKKLKKII